MKIIKQIGNIYVPILALFIISSCSDSYLDQAALGALSEDTVADQAGVEKLLIGAYAALDGQQGGNAALGGGGPWEASPDNWIYGTVAGGEASKGSEGGDQPAIDQIAKFISNSSNGFYNSKWKATYEGVVRCNNTIKFLEKVEDIEDAERKSIMAQARFLRGHYYFELKKMFNMVPWIDETTENAKVPNDADIWPKIEADFQYAYDNLPETQADFARANKWAAGAYLGKTYLYEKEFGKAKDVFTIVINSGVNQAGVKYNLVANFEDNFDAATENNSESVFDIQMVANDGTNSVANANNGSMLNFPYFGPFRCCGFFQPSQDLVNSYKTDVITGLPDPENYNQNPIPNDLNVDPEDPWIPYAGSLDPRLDWTVGRRGIPYHDWGNYPGKSWARDPNYGGPYYGKKHVYWQATQGLYADQSSFAPSTAINVHIIRFADVLLMAAEAEAQAGTLSVAMDYVNQVRNRAANPDGFLKKYIDDNAPLDGFSNQNAANYNIKPYTATNFGSKEAALKAIYFERKLELAMEGNRFFDLSRWGIAEETLNAYFDYQGTVTSDIRGGQFNSGKNEYYPIPQAQIDLSIDSSGAPTLKQNPGY